MQLEVEKRDGTPFKTNLNTLAKVIYEQLFEDDLLRNSYDEERAVIVINSIYDAIEKHVEFKNE
jgi:hypothetical protein